MANEGTPAGTTRPARRRPAASKATPAKAAPVAKPEAAVKPEAEKTNITRFQVELEHAGTTKSYEKFAFPDSYKGVVVGTVYAPIGTSRVVALVIGSDDTEVPES